MMLLAQIPRLSFDEGRQVAGAMDDAEDRQLRLAEEVNNAVTPENDLAEITPLELWDYPPEPWRKTKRLD